MLVPDLFTILVQADKDDGGYVAQVLEMPGCITQGDDMQELFEMLLDAMQGWSETMAELQ